MTAADPSLHVIDVTSLDPDQAHDTVIATVASMTEAGLPPRDSGSMT